MSILHELIRNVEAMILAPQLDLIQLCLLSLNTTVVGDLGNVRNRVKRKIYNDEYENRFF